MTGDKLKLKDGKKEKIDTSKLGYLDVNLDNIKLSQDVNKRRIYGDNIPYDKIGHWICPVCELYFRDSNKYMKHLNSPEHNAKLGMSLKVRPTTDEEVLRRVQQWEDFYIKGIPVPPLFKEDKSIEIDENTNQAQNTEEIEKLNENISPNSTEIRNENIQNTIDNQQNQNETKSENLPQNAEAEEEYAYEYEYGYEEEDQKE